MNLNELKNNFEPISKNLPKIPSNYQKKLLQLVENLSLSKQKFLRGEDLKQVDKFICDHNKSEVKVSDLLTLFGKNWINDTIVDTYSSMS